MNVRELRHQGPLHAWRVKRLKEGFLAACRRLGVRPTRFVFCASITAQAAALYEQVPGMVRSWRLPEYELRRGFPVSTSRFGVGQVANSNCTPLGLHMIAAKVGGGWPTGTVLKSRLPVGFTWQGQPSAPIAHRVLWLAGLEPGFNQGNGVDSFSRYIYIHGVGDETTLGRTASHGCIHLASNDLIPLYDQLPVGTLVWIALA